MRRVNRSLLIAVALALCLTTLAGAQDGDDGDQPAAPDGGDEIDLVISDVGGVALSVQLSQNVDDAATGVPLVVLASTAAFPDAMASAVLQASGPLLLVPPEPPLPGEIFAELDRLNPAEVVLLGGTGAIDGEVEEELNRLGFATRRIAGATRFETATQIAASVRPDATQAVLVRAFDPAGGNATSAWADSVAAGALSAQLSIPILLTDQAGLTPATAEYLDGAPVQTVIIVGGEGAVGPGVEQQLRDRDLVVSRVAGQTRFETALAVADLRRLNPTRAVVIDGVSDDGWQAGFVAARHAALEGAPILPIAGDVVPDSIGAYLDALQPDVLTCLAVTGAICDQARDPAGTEDAPAVVFNPASGSAVSPGETLLAIVDDPERVLTGTATIQSNCLATPLAYLPEGAVSFALGLPPEEPGGDQPPPSGPVPVQPSNTAETGGPGGEPGPTQTAEPVEPNEPDPSPPYPTTCQARMTFERTDGGALVSVGNFNVVDLRPRIRVASFPQREDEPVVFQDRSDGLIDAWLWDFDDGGATSAEVNPTHTYATPGCRDVSLTVTSSLRHWFNGRLFQDTEVRTVAVDPADDGTARVEVQVLNTPTNTPSVGETVEMVDPDTNAVLDVATTDADGRAVFADVPNDGPLAPDQELLFRPEEEPEKGYVQTLAPGHTICGPVIRLGPTGDVEVVVIAEESGAPIEGADVELLLAELGDDYGGETAEDGTFVATDVPVGEYDVTVTATDRVTFRQTIVLAEDEVLTIDAVMPRTEAAPAEGG